MAIPVTVELGQEARCRAEDASKREIPVGSVWVYDLATTDHPEILQDDVGCGMSVFIVPSVPWKEPAVAQGIVEVTNERKLFLGRGNHFLNFTSGHPSGEIGAGNLMALADLPGHRSGRRLDPSRGVRLATLGDPGVLVEVVQSLELVRGWPGQWRGEVGRLAPERLRDRVGDGCGSVRRTTRRTSGASCEPLPEAEPGALSAGIRRTRPCRTARFFSVADSLREEGGGVGGEGVITPARRLQASQEIEPCEPWPRAWHVGRANTFPPRHRAGVAHRHHPAEAGGNRMRGPWWTRAAPIGSSPAIAEPTAPRTGP